jgi:Tol biopolymer transport system component
MVIPTFGGPERKIADLDCGDCFPWIDYAPDGKSVAVCERVNGVESIVLISMDTGAKSRLTTPPPGLKDLGLRFSPDGQNMALARGVGVIISDIYVMPANGGETKRLTNENGLLHDLAWTTDSREIIFGSGYRENGSLRRVSATGGIPQLIAGASIGAIEPAVSRSGHRLAFVSSEHQQSIRRLELLQPGNRAGESSKLIESPRQNTSPEYSPDGRKITFTSGRSGAPEIWTANADGSEPLQLTAFRGPVTGSSTWSPDGRQITFDSWLKGNGDIWLMNADGGSLRKVTTNPTDDCAPHWSRDGRWIYFASDRTGQLQVWKVEPETGRELQMTHHGGFNAMESPDGKILYYFKDPEVWKMPVAGGVEVPAIVTADGQRVKVADRYDWQVFDDGIYIIRSPDASHPANQIEFFSFKTRRCQLIKTLQPGPMPDAGGLRITSDRHWALFAQTEKEEENVMLVNNFR